MVALIPTQPVAAATFNLTSCDPDPLVNGAALTSAITTAESNGAVDTINLGSCTYLLSGTLHIRPDGGNALTINGSGDGSLRQAITNANAFNTNDTTEGTINPIMLTFTSANWDEPQTVTVTGVDNAIVDGNIAYTIITGLASSGDTSYEGFDPDDVEVMNNDNDTAGITINPTAGLVTTEAGGTAQFTVVLNAQPSADVTLDRRDHDRSRSAKRSGDCRCYIKCLFLIAAQIGMLL